MKRSKMLEILAAHIRNEFAPLSEQGWDLSLSHAVAILDHIEDLGMLPPATMFYMDIPVGTGNTLCSEECRWEEEND